MNKYSKILHHISASDMRQTHLKKLNEKKKEEKFLKDEKEYISSLKFDWRKSFEEGMTSSSVFSQTVDAEPGVDLNVIDVTNGKSFGIHPDGVAAHGYSANGLQGGTVVRDSGTGTGSDGGFNIGKHLAFTGDSFYGLRWAALNPIDSSALDTIVITAIRGNDNNGGEDPDAENEDLEVWYRTKDMPQNGWRGIDKDLAGNTIPGINPIIIPVGSDSSGLRDWSLNLPAHVRTPETQFMLVQNTSSGTEFDHYGVTEIKFRRNTPLNVVVPLEDPKAVSFINYTNEGDPKKRKKKLEDQLKASKEYTDKVLGSDFPGMGATLDDTTASPIGKDQVAQAHKDAGTLGQQLKKALGKESDITEPTSKSTVDTIKKVSKDGGKIIQYQQTDDITGEPIEKKIERSFSQFAPEVTPDGEPAPDPIPVNGNKNVVFGSDAESLVTDVSTQNARNFNNWTNNVYSGGSEGAIADVENIDKLYNNYVSSGTNVDKTVVDDFLRDNIPGYSNVMDFVDNLPWNDPNHAVGKWIDNNEWWVEPIIGALAGAVGAKNAYKTPYNVSNTKVNQWKNSVPVKGSDGKYTNIQLTNPAGNLIGKKFLNPKTGKWETMMRPTDKSSVLDKAKWELDQVQHTNASFHNYEKTGINPGIKDISPTRLADIDAPGSMKSGPTVGAQWVIDKATGAAAGAAAGAATATGSDDQTSGTTPEEQIAQAEQEAELTDDEKEELKNQGKSEEEIKQEEEQKKNGIWEKMRSGVERLFDNILTDREGFFNIIDLITGPLQAALNFAGTISNLLGIESSFLDSKDLAIGKINNSIAIARSQLSGRIVNIQPNDSEYKLFKNHISLGSFISNSIGPASIPISDVRHEYADANIYVERDKNGRAVIKDNTGGTKQDLTWAAFPGLTAHGQGYAQMIIPPDGKVPYVHYYDYSYNNMNNADDIGGEMKSLFEGLSDLSLLLSSQPSIFGNLGNKLRNGDEFLKGLQDYSSLGEGWPGGIHGAALTDFKIHLDELPQEIQNMINAHPLSWTEERISKMTDDQVWDQLSFETAEDVEWFDDNFEKLMEKYHPELYKNHVKWNEVDGKLKDITKQPEYTAASDAAKEYVETVKENYKELIANVEKEIPLPEGDYPEWDPSSDPDLEAQKEVTTKAWSTYQQKWDEAKPAMDAYSAHASTLEKKGNMLHGTFDQIEELKRLESEMNALLDVWDKASDAWESSLQREGKLFTVYQNKLTKERKPWDDAYKKQRAAEDKLIAERDKKVEAAQKAYEDTYSVRKGQGGKLLNGGDWKHPETGEVIPGMDTIRGGLEKEKDELSQLMLLEQRAYGETLMKEQKAWIWKTRYRSYGDGKSWTPKGGSGGSGKGKPKPKPQNRYDTRRSQLALDEPIVRDDQQNSYKPRGTFMQETTFDRIKKMRKNFDYEGKPSPDGFPENDPPKLDPKTGMHPRYGKNASRYKKLDPVSARSMPKTGDPETDAEVAKAAKKPK